MLSYWSFFPTIREHWEGCPAVVLITSIVKEKGGKKKKKGENSQKVMFVQCSGSPEGLERHKDALGVRVVVLVTAGMERDPREKGLSAEQGDTSHPTFAPPQTATKQRLLHP